MKKRRLVRLCFSLFLLFRACAGQADSAVVPAGPEAAYAGKLFDNSYVHRIDIRLADESWAGLLADPISKEKYTADVVIDGETVSEEQEKQAMADASGLVLQDLGALVVGKPAE